MGLFRKRKDEGYSKIYKNPNLTREPTAEEVREARREEERHLGGGRSSFGRRKPAACVGCGGPYPSCRSSCKIFD